MKTVALTMPDQPFDGFEIHPCKDVNKELEKPLAVEVYEQCTPEEAEIWSLYVHMCEGGIQCIGDFETEQEATQMQIALEQTIELYAGKKEPKQVPGFAVAKDILTVVDIDQSLLTERMKAFLVAYPEFTSYRDIKPSEGVRIAENLINICSIMEYVNEREKGYECALYNQFKSFAKLAELNDAAYIRFTQG